MYPQREEKVKNTLKHPQDGKQSRICIGNIQTKTITNKNRNTTKKTQKRKLIIAILRIFHK